jgi:hypothetical protein
MLDGSMVIPLILNIVLASIPEETFFVVFSLIIMKRYDLLALKKANIFRIIIIVVVVASSSTILRTSSILDAYLAPLYGVFSIFLFIIILFGIKTPKGILKAFLSVCAAFLTAIAMEILVFPILNSIPDFNAEEANKPGIMLIVLSIPERVMQIILVTMLLLKKQSFMKLGFFKVISRNKPLAYITGGLVIFNLIFLYIMFKLIFFNNILTGTAAVTQVLTVALVIVFPLLNMSVLLGVINYSVNKYTYTRLYVQEETKVLRVLVRTLLQQQRYSEVDAQLESFVAEVKKIK